MGNISSHKNQAAGICGYGQNENGLVFICNSYNIGNITAVKGAGGIFGNGAFNGSVEISNVYNMGTISDGSYNGGILGYWSVEGTNPIANVSYCYNLNPMAVGGGIAHTLGFTQNTANYCYNIDSNKFKVAPDSETGGGIIDATQNLSPSLTINNTTCTTLLTALNAWVDANKSTYPELKNWVMGDNGYPTFAE